MSLESAALEHRLEDLAAKISIVQNDLKRAQTDIKEEIANACAVTTGALTVVIAVCMLIERESTQALFFTAAAIAWFCASQTSARGTANQPKADRTPPLAPQAQLATPVISAVANPESAAQPKSPRAARVPLQLDGVHQPKHAQEQGRQPHAIGKSNKEDICGSSCASFEEESKADAEDDLSEASPRARASSLLVDGRVIKTKEERQLVDDLRARLVDFSGLKLSRSQNLGDCSLIRFVRARNGNLDAAEKMYRAAADWREATRPEEIRQRLEDDMKPIFECLTGGWCMHDKEGAPVLYERVGRLDVPGLMACINDPDVDLSEQDIIDHHIWHQEMHTRKLQEAEDLFGVPQYQLVVVTDLEGLGMKHFNRSAFKILKKMLHIDDSNYCERLKVQFIINAPRIFGAIWAIVKTFLDPNTRAKIQIFSGCPTSALLERIEADKLPKALGGNLCLNGDDYCASLIKPGKPFPRR